MKADSSISPLLDSIIKALSANRDALLELREVVLANAVMLGEIPAPTFKEEQRIRFLSDRFTEDGLENISVDEVGNGMAILPGKTGSRSILLVARADTVFSSTVDHSVTVSTDVMTGPGIADNSLGLAVVSALPTLLDKLDIQFDSDLILLGATRSLGHGNIEGLHFFLDNVKKPIQAGICVAGVHLGRLSYSCLGMLRGEIICRVPPETDWERANSSGAIVNLNKILSRILAIPTPRVPRTSIILGSIAAGNSFNTVPSHALLRFELRSEQAGMVSNVCEQIEDILDEITAETVTDAELLVIARRQPGGISFNHPLVKATRAIMEALGIKPIIAPSVSELSALINKNIPSITLGISEGENLHEQNESIRIEPTFRGLAQLIGVLQAIDGGLCDAD